MKTFLQGLALGLSMVFPGISGGTVAFLLGIYEKLINEISLFQPSDLFYFKNFKKYDLNFIFPLLTGMFSALVVFVFLSKSLLTEYQDIFYILVTIFVLIFLPDLFKKVPKKTKYFVGILILSLLFCFLFMFFDAFALDSKSVSVRAWDMVLAGLLSSVALLIPGFSGSYLLLLVGLYQPLLQILKELQLFYVVIFTLSLISGLVLMSRLMSRLFKKFPAETLCLGLSLILGSLYPLIRVAFFAFL